MTHEPSRATTGQLTSTQQSRVDFARRDYRHARDEDLASLSDASLILLVERLRARLGDILNLIDEITTPR